MEKRKKISLAVILCSVFGSSIGLILGNFGFGIAIGMLVGVVVGNLLSRKQQREN